MCVCLLLVRARAKIKGNKYGATRSAGDYRRKVQLARFQPLANLCNGWGGWIIVVRVTVHGTWDLGGSDGEGEGRRR